MSNETQNSTEFSVEQAVPMDERTYGFWDMAATWLGANCHPSSWWAGGVVAAAGLMGASMVNLTAIPLSCLIVALVGLIGFKVGTTSMGLSRFSMGIRGSKFFGSLAVMSSVGWAGLSHFLGAITITYILNEMFGMPAYLQEGSQSVMVAGVLFIGILSILFVAISGSKSIKIVQKILGVAILLLSGYMSYVVITSYDINAMMAWQPDETVFTPFGVAFDMLLAFNLGWVVSACDFTRYAKNTKAATVAPALGLAVAGWWFVAVGTMSTIAIAASTGVFDPNMSDPSSVASQLGLGTIAFAVIILTTVTTNIISIYVASNSLRNVFPTLKFRPASWITGIATIVVGLAPIFMGGFYDTFNVFLGYIGAVFPPLITIIMVDFYFVRKQQYDMSRIADKTGPYWYHNGINWYGIGAWAVGAATFLTLKNIAFGAEAIGYVLPSMFTTAILYYVLAKIAIKNNAYTDVK